MRDAAGFDLGGVLDRLHQGDRIAAALGLAAGLHENAVDGIRSGRLIEADVLMGLADGFEVLREGCGFAHVGDLFQRGAHGIGELVAVDIDSGAARLRDGCEGQRQRRMCDIAAANVEGPCDGVRIGDDQRIALELGEFALDVGDLLFGGDAGVFHLVQHDLALRRRGTVFPDDVERIAVSGHELCAGGGAGARHAFRAIDRVQPRVIAQRCA